MAEFNPQIHQKDDNGDPIRTEAGVPKLRTDWMKRARDHMGRAFNPKIHEGSGDRPKLNDAGHIVVKRRDGGRKPMGAINGTRVIHDKYKQEGYALRMVNDEQGRIDKFLEHDWEPVVDEEGGRVSRKVGQARGPDTTQILMRKPKEWYDEDQAEKRRQRTANLERQTAPGEGEYLPKGREKALQDARLR